MEREIEVDQMALAFAKIMTIFTIIGIVLMIIPAVFYFMGQNQYIPLSEATKYWQNPTVDFWKQIKGVSIHGYDWIFKNLQYSDCQSMIGVLLLMIAPLLSMFAAIPKASGKIYKVLLLIASAEFIVSIILKGIL